MLRYLVLCVIAMPLLSAPATAAPGPLRASKPQYIDFQNTDALTATSGATPGQTVLTTPDITTRSPWNELIVSWNADTPPGSALRVEARALYPDHATQFYDLGYWAAGDHVPARTSRTGQKDADGDVATDTLILTKPAPRVQVRLTLDGPVTLRYLGLSLTDSRHPYASRKPNKAAWGRELDVPPRSQLSYPGGEVWCSPTSVTMVMAYWAQQSGHPDWNVDVPEAARAIYDAAWHGTGNWPFNTAYAGSFPGLRAYITRLEDIRGLEDWVVAGVPPIVSVSYSAQSGDDTPGDNGHIMVCVGFTKTGDVIVNDPWAHLEKGESVRKVFRRERFAAMWAASKHTVYLIYPERLHPRPGKNNQGKNYQGEHHP